MINEKELLLDGFTDGIKSKNIHALKCLLALIPAVIACFFFSIYITGFTWFVGAFSEVVEEVEEGRYEEENK